MMKRVICIVMVVLFLATIITGIVESHVHPGNSGHHVFISILLLITVGVHA